MASRGRGQRIAIWIIAIAMTVGTIGSFVVIILANDNSQADQNRINQLSEDYTKAYEDYQKDQSKKDVELSEDYFGELDKYSGRVAKFDSSSVDELEKVDLKVGSGNDIKAGGTAAVYYIGWGPEGEIFDSSINGKQLKSPFKASLSGGVIQGWIEGVPGMKEGGVRELTIPSDLAYGESGTGDGSIAPNTPIKFIILAIPVGSVLSEPEIPEELLKYYQQGLY